MKSLIVWVAFLLPFVSYGQLKIESGASLLYYVENNSGNNQFLIPYVESELKALNDSNATGSHPLFREVNSLNLYLSGDNTTKALIRAIYLYTKTYKPITNNSNDYKEGMLIRKNLINKDWFLKININTLNSLIEYQFVLFRVLSGVDNSLPVLKLDKYRAASVFINPTSNDYKTKLRMTIRQIISEGNEAPIPYITWQNKNVSGDLFVPTGHVVLQGCASDTDSVPADLKYTWKVTNNNDEVVYTQSGKSFTADILASTTLNVRLTVSDGINIRHCDNILNVLAPPQILIDGQPYSSHMDFYNNTYHLYSFHKLFKLGDFDELFAPGLIDENVNWPKLLPNIRILSNLANKDGIQVSAIKYKVNEDSLSRYKESLIPDIHFGNNDLSLSDEWSAFKLTAFPVIIDSTQSDSQHSVFVHPYAIYQHNSSAFDIPVPSDKFFKVVARNHNSQSSEYFRVEFDKISRFNPYINESFSYDLSAIDEGNKIHHLNMLFLGAGSQFRVVPGIAIDASLGTLNASASRLDYNFTSHSYYFKAAAQFCLWNIDDHWRFSVFASALRRAGYGLLTDTLTHTKSALQQYKYITRPGFGIVIEPLRYNSYHFEPVGPEFFFTYYPSGTWYTGKLIEVGVKVKLFIKKRN